MHLPTDLGMRAYSLCRAERELGLDSHMVIKSPGVHVSGCAEKPLYSENPFLYGLRLLRASFKSFNADIIMANVGSSLLDFRRYKMDLLDIPIYDLLNKRIIVTFQGCEIRLCEVCPVRTSLPSNMNCSNAVESSYRNCDRMKLARFKIWSRHADAILGITPDLCILDRVNFTAHAKYIDSDLLNLPKRRIETKVRIGHMSRRHINGLRIQGLEYLKGTPWIETQIQTLLKDFSREIEYVPIEDLPWNKCLELIASCDIIIDQVISGWYGGISVEAALMGILPIAYINSHFLRYVPDSMQNHLPLLALQDKEYLIDVLIDLIRNRDQIKMEAFRCKENAKMFHDAKIVAKQIIAEYYNC